MLSPLYRQEFDAVQLLAEHPPQFRHPHKSALFEMAYPNGGATPALISVTRWRQVTPDEVQLPDALATEVRPDFYDYTTSGNPSRAGEWHVNFADPRLFVAYGSGLLAQDEMQVVEHPLLGSIREALLSAGLSAMTCDEVGATPILVRGVERRLMVATNPDAAAGRPNGLYGNRFALASIDVVRRASRRVDPPTFSNIIAMAAPSGGRGDYTEQQIGSIFATAYTAFAAAVQESPTHDSHTTIVHTGFWGCGAFGGNRKLMIALQVLAARAAGVGRLVVHAGETGSDDARRGLDIAESLVQRCGTPCTLRKLAGRAEMLALRWGVSDGN